MILDPERDLIYGTAWKEAATADCVRAALEAGFRAFDTANQRKHYHEAGVGEGIADFLRSHGRDALWIQTKYTYLRGQDERLPYDADAPPPVQVRQSMYSSLEHLGVTRVDSLLLHGPEHHPGLTETDWEVWRAMEALHDEGLALQIGVSNIDSGQLRVLLDRARVRPSFVQNRCYANRNWDAAIRSLCAEAGVIYQGFSLLTANRPVWNHRKVAEIARRHGATPAQVLFAFSRTRGILPMTGTTDPNHMRQDLATGALRLSEGDLQIIEACSAV